MPKLCSWNLAGNMILNAILNEFTKWQGKSTFLFLHILQGSLIAATAATAGTACNGLCY